MEPSVVFVQHQPFQFYRLFWSDVEKNAKRFRRRRSHGKISNVAEDGAEHSVIWWMLMTVTMESTIFMGNNFLPEQLSIHCEQNRSQIQTNVRHICQIGVWTRWDLRIGNNWFWKSFMEMPVIDWWRKSYQSSTHEGLQGVSPDWTCSFRINVWV